VWNQFVQGMIADAAKFAIPAPPDVGQVVTDIAVMSGCEYAL